MSEQHTTEDQVTGTTPAPDERGAAPDEVGTDEPTVGVAHAAPVEEAAAASDAPSSEVPSSET
ncbi:hypothetical protein, partial [Pseudonocardia oceani]